MKLSDRINSTRNRASKGDTTLSAERFPFSSRKQIKISKITKGRKIPQHNTNISLEFQVKE